MGITTPSPGRLAGLLSRLRSGADRWNRPGRRAEKLSEPAREVGLIDSSADLGRHVRQWLRNANSPGPMGSRATASTTSATPASHDSCSRRRHQTVQQSPDTPTPPSPSNATATSSTNASPMSTNTIRRIRGTHRRLPREHYDEAARGPQAGANSFCRASTRVDRHVVMQIEPLPPQPQRARPAARANARRPRRPAPAEAAAGACPRDPADHHALDLRPSRPDAAAPTADPATARVGLSPASFRFSRRSSSATSSSRG